MSQEFQATYEQGILRLDQPLALPENSRVAGILISVPNVWPGTEQMSDEQFKRELDELSWDAPLLPPDFSRADIYLDHD